MAEAPKTLEAESTGVASADVKRGRRAPLRKVFGRAGHALGNFTKPITERFIKWKEGQETKKSALAASEVSLRKAQGEARKKLGAGLGKTLLWASPVLAFGVLSWMMFGTSWGVPTALLASQYGLPIFGRMLGGQFAVEDMSSVSDWWNAVVRHYGKDRIDFGKWIMDGEVVVKEKPQTQAGETVPQG